MLALVFIGKNVLTFLNNRLKIYDLSVNFCSNSYFFSVAVDIQCLLVPGVTAWWLDMYTTP